MNSSVRGVSGAVSVSYKTSTALFIVKSGKSQSCFVSLCIVWFYVYFEISVIAEVSKLQNGTKLTLVFVFALLNVVLVFQPFKYSHYQKHLKTILYVH